MPEKQYMFVFDNPDMESDKLTPKGKVECYKAIACNASSEQMARALSHRPNYDPTNTLSPAWILTGKYPLSEAWNV